MVSTTHLTLLFYLNHGAFEDIKIFKTVFKFEILSEWKMYLNIDGAFMYKSPYFKMQFEHRELATSKTGSEIS
jgi:hypothetical protein